MMLTSLDVKGPFELTSDAIDKNVRNKSMGVFALGFSRNNSFIVRYIGRSEVDMNNDLKIHVGEYAEFKFSYSNSAKEAHAKLLHVFDRLGVIDKLDNEINSMKPIL